MQERQWCAPCACQVQTGRLGVPALVARRAIDELPAHGQSRPEVRELMRKVNVCMAEALLKAEPPKAQVGNSSTSHAWHALSFKPSLARQRHAWPMAKQALGEPWLP